MVRHSGLWDYLPSQLKVGILVFMDLEESILVIASQDSMNFR
jgi:hypothetical protein